MKPEGGAGWLGLLALFFVWCLTRAPRSLLRNRTETPATQAIPKVFTLIHTQIYFIF